MAETVKGTKMAGSLNRAMLIGNLGQDPEIRSTQDGRKIAQLSIATSESWKDKATGERKDRTQWHRVVIFNEGIAGVAEKYLSKGDKVYVEGQIETRKWTDKDGQDRYTTEIVLRPYNGTLTMLQTGGQRERQPGEDDGDHYTSEDYAQATRGGGAPQRAKAPSRDDDLSDEIPF